MREKRAQLVKDMRAILDKADAEKRDVSAEEQATYAEIEAEVDKLAAEIDKREKLEAQESALAATQAEARQELGNAPATTPAAQAVQNPAEYQRTLNLAMKGWAFAGRAANRITNEMRAAMQALSFESLGNELTFRMNPDVSELRRELRTLMATSGNYGSQTIPAAFLPRWEWALLAFANMRNVATVIRTDSGAALTIPTANDTGNKGGIVSENTQITTETAVGTSSVTLNAYVYSSYFVKVSWELMQDSAFNLPAYVGAACGERIGRIQADHFTTGTNSSQPNGIVTAATLGKTAAAAYAITFDEIMDLFHSVDPAYRLGAGWMMHDGIVKYLRKLKDGDNQYLWQPGVQMGVPDMILGKPVTINQSMQATLLGSKKTVLFGDFSKYLIRDVTDLRVLRLDERFADYMQTGFIAFQRTDADLLDAGTHPVKYLQQAAVGGGTGSGSGA